MSKEALKQALNLAENVRRYGESNLAREAIEVIKALSKQEQDEPVAYLNPDDLCADTAFRWCKIDEFTQPVYTKPQPSQKPWVGLTDEEKYDITSNLIKGWVVEALVRAIEAKLKEKNT